MRTPRGNFTAYLTEERLGRKRLVPGSVRHGHNVVTNAGLDWLRDLTRWFYPLSSSDVQADSKRFRWIGVGTGFQFEARGIQSLVNGLAISTGVYMQALAPPSYTTEYGVKFTSTFATTDFGGGSYDISEAAIYVDVDFGSGPVLAVDTPNNVPVAYKSITPALPKTGLNTLVIIWEFRF